MSLAPFKLLLSSAAAILLAVCAHGQEIATHFSPNGGISTAIADVIDKSEKTIDAAIYSISDNRITAALARAAERGVAVRVVVDRTQTSGYYSTAHALARTPVKVQTDTKEPLQHNKYLIADGQTVVTGSANWTMSANARNAENIVVINHEKTAADFEADFTKHWNHSIPFRRAYKSQRDEHRSTPVPFNPKNSPESKEY